MAIWNSLIFNMLMGKKKEDQPQADETSPFDKYRFDAENNPFGQSSSDAFTNNLLQGGQKPQYSLNGFGQGFFAGNEPDNSTIPLSALTSNQQNPQQQPQQRYPLQGYTLLKNLR